MWLRFIVTAFILGAIFIGVRRIMKDWSARFRDLDKQDRERDLKERQRPDVVELKRSEDGVFRPDDENNRR